MIIVYSGSRFGGSTGVSSALKMGKNHGSACIERRKVKRTAARVEAAAAAKIAAEEAAAAAKEAEAAAKAKEAEDKGGPSSKPHIFHYFTIGQHLL